MKVANNEQHYGPRTMLKYARDVKAEPLKAVMK